MPALCTGCLCVSQENSDSVGDDIRYSRLCSLPRPARWVLFGGTEPVKEGNVTQSGEREAGRAVHITRVFTMVHCIGHIVTLTVHPGIGRVLEGVDR